ncbi:MAG: hypothetical protein ABSA97_15095 [Verrucomicrobiia bacterium]
MSSHSKHGILSHWRSIVSETVACVSCWSAVPSATAQKSESPSLIAFLSVSTIPAESIRTNISERIDRQALTERDRQAILMPHRKPTDAEAWEKFESEFRPEQRSPSPVKHQIETAKYGLDVTVFAVDRFVKSITNHADFEFNQGRLRRTPANPLERSLGNPRVKLDLDLTHGRPYLGARVVIPFGN